MRKLLFKESWGPAAVSALLSVFAALVSCSSPGREQSDLGRGSQPQTPTSLVLKYSDFGPQAMAYEALGYEWFQWEATGGPDPSQAYDVRVVVFKDLPLESVKTEYPVDKAKGQDFRYIGHDQALAYLEKNIKGVKSDMPELAVQLETTRQKILAHFQER
jgi:hypothetical protein